jgi:protoporphyrinogen oxidase
LPGVNLNSQTTISGNLAGRRIGVLGAGITGLTAAFYLLRAGADVTVIEAQPQVGGLSTHFDFGSFTWDRFYHCILPSDRPLLQLIEDLGLSQDLRWTKTKVGFFADGALYSMSSSLDFLRFPPLSLWQKVRLGAGILYACRIRDGRELETELASDWLTRIFGKKNYDKIWGPLLKCKLGACREEASASFIWATISRLYSTRENNAKRSECLGYVPGGYRTILGRLLSKIERMGGKVLTGSPVEKIFADEHIECRTATQTFDFDSVISTLPSPVLRKITPQLAPEHTDQLGKVKYLGVICIALVLKRSLSPYYVTNLIDDVPFTGIIEMTNLISRQETAGKTLVYLPKYTAPGDPLFEVSEEVIWDSFKTGLTRVFPDLEDTDIERRFLFRERFVQPIPVLHYSDIVPNMETNIDNLFVANTTQIINSTLNNNEMVKIAHRGAEAVRAALASDDVRPHPSSSLALSPGN